MSFEHVHKYPEEELNQICLRRGIAFENKEKHQILKELKLWMAISNLVNVPNSLLLYTRISDYTDEMF